MTTKASTLGMTHEEWLKRRKEGIGDSDADTVCGLDLHASPMSVHQDKTSQEISAPNNEVMRQGEDLEEYVTRRFTEVIGLEVRKSNTMYVNSQYPFMPVSVGRLVVGEDAGLECKTVSAYNVDKWRDGETPPHYVI